MSKPHLYAEPHWSCGWCSVSCSRERATAWQCSHTTSCRSSTRFHCGRNKHMRTSEQGQTDRQHGPRIRRSLPGLTFDLSEVTDTDCTTRSSVQIPTDLQTGVIRLGSTHTDRNKVLMNISSYVCVCVCVCVYLQCSSSQLENASSSSPMFITTILVSGQTCCHRNSRTHAN